MADQADAGGPQRWEIRSYRTVFTLERRIYRIDRLRLNPGGIPLRSVAYLVVALLGLFAASHLVLSAWLVGSLPWVVRYLLIPLLVCTVTSLARVDGRPLDAVAGALTGLLLTSRRRCALRPVRRMPGRWRPPELLMLPDGSEPQLRALRFRGPGAVQCLVAHERVIRRGSRARTRAPGRPAVVLRPLPGGLAPARPPVLALPAGRTLEVRAPRGLRSGG